MRKLAELYEQRLYGQHGSSKSQSARTPRLAQDEVRTINQAPFSSSVYRVSRSICLGAALLSAFALLSTAQASAAEPPTVTISTVSAGETTVEISGTIDTHGGDYTQVYVQESTDKSDWGNSVLATTVFPGETGSHSFSGQIAALEPETTYYARVETQNGNGSVRTFTPETEPFPSATTSSATPVPPVIALEAVSAVQTEGATLEATINPRRFATGYFFQYAPSSVVPGEDWTSPAVQKADGSAVLPADNQGHLVSVQITDLQPGEQYSWRLVAENSGGAAASEKKTFSTERPSKGPFSGCPNETLRTGLAAFLPDCRSYEQVSPIDKGGLYLEGFPDLIAGAPDGSAVTYISGGGSGIPSESVGRQDTTTYLSSLKEGAWSTQSLFPTEAAGRKAGFLGASRNLRFVVDQASHNTEGREGETALFFIDTATHEVTQMTAYQAQRPVEQTFAYDGISESGSRVFFESLSPVTSNATVGKDNLFMWDRETGAVTLVGILPKTEEQEAESEEATAPTGGSFGGAFTWFRGPYDTEKGGSLEGLYVEAVHASSSDGDQVYFTAGGVFETRNLAGQLYLRRGLNGSTPTTIRVSQPEPGIEDPLVEEVGEPLPATFQEATPNGNYAFFTSSQKLTHDATTGEFDAGSDLYRFDEREDKIVDIAAGKGGEAGAEVLGVLGVSSDGSSGYFAAKGVVAPGATAGESNIFRFEEVGVSEFVFSFVASVSGGQNPCVSTSGARNWASSSYCANLISGNFSGKTSRVTPDGQTVVFSNGENVYRFSVGQADPDCISCSTTGEKSLGQAELQASFFTAGQFAVPEVGPAAVLTQNMSNDGSRVFFQTPNSLLARDTNGPPSCRYLGRLGTYSNPTCMDVYEWEMPDAPGGTCTRAEVDGGCLYLLSSGNSNESSYFLDSSRDGRSVFIATTSQLVPVDRDNLYDVYRVQSDGGLASQHVLPASPCGEEACRGPATAPSAASSPGTATLQGAGNSRTTKCKKTQVRRGSKCVAKHHRQTKKVHRGSRKHHQRGRSIHRHGSGKGAGK